MKHFNRRLLFSLLMLCLGGLGALLRQEHYRRAADLYGLLTPGHPLAAAVWVLTALALILIVAFAYPYRGKDLERPRPSVPLALSYFLAAAGILADMILSNPLTSGYPGLLWRAAGVLAPVGLIWAGICILRRKQPGFLCHLAPCLFFLFHIIDHYRTWSGNPQMQDFLFSLFAAISLALFSFYCAARDVDLGHRGMRIGSGLAALFFTAVDFSSSGYRLLYVCCILWVLTLLSCPLEPQSAPQTAQPDPAPKEGTHDPA